MGCIRNGSYIGGDINKPFCVDIVKEWNILNFVETGTYEGNTTIWANEVFKKVYTIENSKILYDKLESKHKKFPNIKWLFGNSIDHLPGIIEEIGNNKCVFWLDAHYSCDNITGGKMTTHPLIGELRIVLNAPTQHIIFIDDFRLMAYPAQQGTKYEWPRIDQVLKPVFDCKYNYHIYIMQDFILLLEPEGKKILDRNSDKLMVY